MLNSLLRKAARRNPRSVYQLIYRRDVVAFFYHVVSDRDLPHLRHLYGYKVGSMFEHDLLYLRRDCRVVSYDEVLDHFKRGNRCRRRVMLELRRRLRRVLLGGSSAAVEALAPMHFFYHDGLVDNRSLFFRHAVHWPSTESCPRRKPGGAPPRKAEEFVRDLHPRHRGLITG